MPRGGARAGSGAKKDPFSPRSRRFVQSVREQLGRLLDGDAEEFSRLYDLYVSAVMAPPKVAAALPAAPPAPKREVADRIVRMGCAGCAGIFEYLKPAGVQGKDRKYCGDVCKRAAKERRGEAATVCQACARTFAAHPYRPQKFCSSACSNVAKAALTRKWPTEKESRAAATDRRRTRKFGVGYERFTRRSIYERDSWICQICKWPVDRGDVPDAHLRPALDHIHPLSKQGAHARANVQCAHWICNSRKGSKLDGGASAARKMEQEYAERGLKAGSRAKARSE